MTITRQDLERLEDRLDARFDRLEARLEVLTAAGTAHAALCDADRRRLESAVATNTATNAKQEIRWAKVLAWAAGSGVAGAGVLEGLLRLLGGG